MANTDDIEYWKRLALEIDMIRPDLQRLGFKKDNIRNLHTEYPAIQPRST
jgi:hypothetical protein